MQKPVVAVFDRKIALYDPPFVCRHVGEAIRDFELVKTNDKTKFHKNPEDFLLFQLATFDESTGAFHTLETPVQLG